MYAFLYVYEDVSRMQRRDFLKKGIYTPFAAGLLVRCSGAGANIEAGCGTAGGTLTTWKTSIHDDKRWMYADDIDGGLGDKDYRVTVYKSSSEYSELAENTRGFGMRLELSYWKETHSSGIRNLVVRVNIRKPYTDKLNNEQRRAALDIQYKLLVPYDSNNANHRQWVECVANLGGQNTGGCVIAPLCNVKPWYVNSIATLAACDVFLPTDSKSQRTDLIIKHEIWYNPGGSPNSTLMG